MQKKNLKFFFFTFLPFFLVSLCNRLLVALNPFNDFCRHQRIWCTLVFLLLIVMTLEFLFLRFIPRRREIDVFRSATANRMSYFRTTFGIIPLYKFTTDVLNPVWQLEQHFPNKKNLMEKGLANPNWLVTTRIAPSFPWKNLQSYNGLTNAASTAK